MCFELKNMGYCDNAIYKAMMQKHCLSECGANACFDKRADLCPYWKQDPNNFCTNSFYSPQTVEEWCNATCNCGTQPAPPAGNAKKK
uniref:ShKT domain-containing protein n=3 Tax=Meloidogyne TaxID=189290 RepID=A0A6V7TTZ3_MELEN|nr:unnamed protein product [Meloidogyne enterolobii]